MLFFSDNVFLMWITFSLIDRVMPVPLENVDHLELQGSLVLEEELDPLALREER